MQIYPYKLFDHVQQTGRQTAKNHIKINGDHKRYQIIQALMEDI